MAGSPGTRLAPDLPPGPRAALVIATTSYQDPELSQLRAPADDAQDLAEVLADPGIGGFTVTPVIDADERQVRRAIDVFLSGRGIGDVVLVYLSCHGVLDRRNRLYFAAADTVKDSAEQHGYPGRVAAGPAGGMPGPPAGRDPGLLFQRRVRARQQGGCRSGPGAAAGRARPGPGRADRLPVR